MNVALRGCGREYGLSIALKYTLGASPFRNPSSNMRATELVKAVRNRDLKPCSQLGARVDGRTTEQQKDGPKAAQLGLMIHEFHHAKTMACDCLADLRRAQSVS